jgi:histone H3/H4
VAKREIRRFQQGKQATRMLVPTASLDKVIREILQNQGTAVSQICPQAREALRISSEEYLTGLFRDATHVAALRKAETINVADFQHVVQQARKLETVMRNTA